MSTQTPPLTDFLLARIAEDEAVAKAAATGDFGWESGGNVVWVKNDPRGDSLDGLIGGRGEWPSWVDGHDITPHIARHDPARVLAECDAKRRIVEQAKRSIQTGYAWTAMEQVLKALALPYADHKDFREEWGAG